VVLAFLPAVERPLGGHEVSGAEHAAAEQERLRDERRRAVWSIVRSARLWLYGASYFFIKLIRYALLFWLPYYLSDRFGFTTRDAAWLSTAFDAGGVVGVVVLGRLSDRVPARGRSTWALVSLVGLVLALVLYVVFGGSGTLQNVFWLALLGALLFGPDALLSGPAAQDAGGVLTPALATGFVNGLGSCGALAQGLVVPALAARYGWSGLFPAFVVFALCAALALVPTLRVASAGAPEPH
ncbi:MAG TPA: MFS transporter, partial [Polyangiaceae bacterium]